LEFLPSATPAFVKLRRDQLEGQPRGSEEEAVRVPRSGKNDRRFSSHWKKFFQTLENSDLFIGRRLIDLLLSSDDQHIFD